MWGGRPRIVLHSKGGDSVLAERGWQLVADPQLELDDVRLRLRHAA
jgi:hypothetical protein